MKSLVILHFKINMLVLVFGVKEKTDLIQSETETRTSKMFFGDFWATVRGNLATIEFTQVLLLNRFGVVPSKVKLTNSLALSTIRGIPGTLGSRSGTRATRSIRCRSETSAQVKAYGQ